MRLFLLLLLIPCCLHAAPDSLQIADKQVLRELYGVLTHTTPADDAVYRWAHRRILFKALGIDSTRRNDTTLTSRVRFGWQQLQSLRISESSEPAVYFKDILRLALHYRYGALILDAVRWGVDVNSFDAATHSTLLNYLETEYRNGTDEERMNWLREYKQVLLAGGAVYFSETDFRMRTLAKKYDRIRPPVDGLFPVQRKAKWGWVNDKNQIIIPLKYKSVRYFTNDFFEVSDDGIHYRVIRKN